MILATVLALHCLRALVDWQHVDPWGTLSAIVESWPDWRDGSQRWAVIGAEVGIRPSVAPFPTIDFSAWAPIPVEVASDYRGRAMVQWSRDDGGDLVTRQEWPGACTMRVVLPVVGR